MKKLLIIFSALGLVACASTPPPQKQVFAQPVNAQNVPITSVANIPAVSFVYDVDVVQMTRTQVIDAVRSCEDSGLRASPVTARRRITGQTSDVVVDIQCLPRYR
jgi:uncharacterized lipoprotein YmbA